jgi:flagellar hook-length control protein FliK
MPVTSMPPNLPPQGAAPLQGSAPGADALAADGAATLAGFAELLRQRLSPGGKGGPEGFAGLPAQLLAPGSADIAADAAPEEQPPDAALAALLPALQALLAPAHNDIATHPAGVQPDVAVLATAPGASAQAAAPMLVDAAAGAAQGLSLTPAAAADKPAAADFAARLATAAAETAGQAAAADGAPVPAAEPAAPVAAAAAHGLSATKEATTHAARIETPVAAPGWEREIGQKVVLLVGRNEQRAELTLTPPSLGRVEVTLTVSGDQTSALFVSANPTVREALEQALPRLREMLADAGVQLGQAQVSAGSSQGNGHQEERPRAAGAGGGRAPADNAATATHWVRRGDGLIDTFA